MRVLAERGKCRNAGKWGRKAKKFIQNFNTQLQFLGRNFAAVVVIYKGAFSQ